MPGKKQPIAAVELRTGRWCLMIAGWVIAMEGDPCREWALDGKRWTRETLDQAATRINSAIEGHYVTTE